MCGATFPQFSYLAQIVAGKPHIGWQCDDITIVITKQEVTANYYDDYDNDVCRVHYFGETLPSKQFD